MKQKNMIISDVKIKNYKSLYDVQLDNLENTVIITGKNSSGKSNLLEALWLFCKDFTLVPESVNTNVPIETNSHLWTNANTENPIIFTITFKFTPYEIRQILPTRMINVLELSRRNIDITIERHLTASTPNLIWITNFVKIEDLEIIRDGLPVNELSAWTIDVDKTGNENPIPMSFIKTSEQLDVVEKYFNEIKTDMVTVIIDSIVKLCKECIKIIFSARSSPSIDPNYGTRTLNIDPNTYNKLLSEGQNLSNKVRSQWINFIRDFEDFIPFNQRLSVVSGQAIVDETNIHLPLHQIGGGTQGLISLLHELFFDIRPIIFIEEPENHMHPGLQKKFYDYIKKNVPQRSREKQIWISTHSPFLLNKSDIRNMWVAKKEENLTQFNHLFDKEDLKDIILELGVKPSDVLFSDAILLVDGYTEEIVIDIWGKKIGIDLVELGCDIIGIGGDQKGKYHLEMWRIITRNAEVPIFMILDSHAKDEVNKLKSEGKIEEECCILSSKQSIEEFYNKEYVIKAIFEEYGIEIKKSELRNTKSATIKKALISKGMDLDGNWWKPVIGQRVAEMMDGDEIPYEYRRILEKIKITLEQS